MIAYKTINEFSNYLIGNNGEVYNKQTQYSKKPTSNYSGKGYLYVDLYNGNKRKRKYIHRLVAEAFIPNPQNKPYINHIDGDTHNNLVENLEWCTPLENVEHASKVIKAMTQYEKANNRRKRKVKMFNRFNGQEVATFESISEAAKRMCIPVSNIVACLKGRQTYTKEYIWMYVEEI
jgi:hypothetical protein